MKVVAKKYFINESASIGSVTPVAVFTSTEGGGTSLNSSATYDVLVTVSDLAAPGL